MIGVKVRRELKSEPQPRLIESVCCDGGSAGAGVMDQQQPEEGLLAPAALLPKDMLAAILARLAPRGLAVARGVCGTWRATIDARRLLRADLLPLSVARIFINFDIHYFPDYFSRPSTGPRAAISGHMDYLPISAETIVSGHCNGLLLLDGLYVDGHRGDHVVNPATRSWATVPPAPALSDHAVPNIFYYRNYPLFDPTLSPYYEVISVPHIKYLLRKTVRHAQEEAEWPPSRCILRVFSSRMNRWEERYFVREGEAGATIWSMRLEMEPTYSTYSKGALYAFCQTNFVMRISLSHNKYQVIKPPASLKGSQNYLGKSEKGVYLASYDQSGLLQVWMIDESCGQMEWLLKHKCDFTHVRRQNCYQWTNGVLIQDLNYNSNNIKEALTGEKYEWDSDNDNVIGNDEGSADEKGDCGFISVLGFHPFKEVVFLNHESEKRGLAYHWTSSKVQDLGNMYPTDFEYYLSEDVWPRIGISFPYTPCWI